MSGQQLNPRERYIATVKFERPDRIPLTTGGPRRSTLRRWESEGLPPGKNWFVHMCKELGISYEFPQKPRVPWQVSFRMIPQFEEKVLEHKDGHYIVQDWMGNITEISDEYDYTYIRNAVDFVTRKWHKFPVETRADFEAMKQRYRVDTPERYSDDFEACCKRAADRDWLLGFSISGPFWQMREWCGFEPLCIMFVEDPDFIREMCDFWSDFVAGVLERVLDNIVVDRVHISEDMAYKGASMISPDMAREFLLPLWKRWGKLLKDAGVPVYDMDSDGNVDQLIPLWIEAGFDLCDPIEVAAGCDINAYRRQFGHRIAYAGGVDKRCIARGGRAIEDEMARLAPVIRDGGYLPGCDHGMPPDISWDNLKHFGRLWAELCGWL